MFTTAEAAVVSVNDGIIVPAVETLNVPRMLIPKAVLICVVTIGAEEVLPVQ